jgi:hypothetical protein
MTSLNNGARSVPILVEDDKVIQVGSHDRRRIV